MTEQTQRSFNVEVKVVIMNNIIIVTPIVWFFLFGASREFEITSSGNIFYRGDQNMKKSFNTASKQCETYEMPLPVIKTIQERDELLKIAEGYHSHFWINAEWQGSSLDGKYVWLSDGSPINQTLLPFGGSPFCRLLNPCHLSLNTQSLTLQQVDNPDYGSGVICVKPFGIELQRQYAQSEAKVSNLEKDNLLMKNHIESLETGRIILFALTALLLAIAVIFGTAFWFVSRKVRRLAQ